MLQGTTGTAACRLQDARISPPASKKLFSSSSTIHPSIHQTTGVSCKREQVLRFPSELSKTLVAVHTDGFDLGKSFPAAAVVVFA